MQEASEVASAVDTVLANSRRQFIVRAQCDIQLGSMRLELRSNEWEFSELRYFPAATRVQQARAADYTVNCCNLNVDAPWPVAQIRGVRDRSYRGGRLAAGYYLTDHFGAPAYLITQGREVWVFAQSFQSILWPFVVKLLLTIHAVDNELLHLKAAAVSIGKSVTLLVGRGGTGKTVLLTQLCERADARFLANTHILVRDAAIFPVASAMRIRNDRCFAPLIAARQLTSAIKSDEYLVDPYVDLGWKVGTAGRIRNICLLDYRTREKPVIGDLDKTVLFDYMENFSLALNIYGLREDVLDHLGGDAGRFSREWSRMKTALGQLIRQAHCYYVSCDAMDPENLRTINRILVGDGGL